MRKSTLDFICKPISLITNNIANIGCVGFYLAVVSFILFFCFQVVSCIRMSPEERERFLSPEMVNARANQKIAEALIEKNRIEREKLESQKK